MNDNAQPVQGQLSLEEMTSLVPRVKVWERLKDNAVDCTLVSGH